MQSVKDTFLMALSSRLNAVNPARTVVIRGATRTAVIAEDAELRVLPEEPMDCFVVRWLHEDVDRSEPLALHTLPCVVHYATRGTEEFSGIDRGRVLVAMDEELSQIVLPRSTPLQDYTTIPATTMTTRVWWSEIESSDVTVDGEALRRTAKITVFALDEVIA